MFYRKALSTPLLPPSVPHPFSLAKSPHFSLSLAKKPISIAVMTDNPTRMVGTYRILPKDKVASQPFCTKHDQKISCPILKKDDYPTLVEIE